MSLTDAEIRRAGGTVKRTRLPDGPRQPVLPPGTLILAFTVEGRPIPWSVSRRGTKSPTLCAWQHDVANAARLHHGIRIAYPHAVRIVLDFYLTDNGRTEPDVVNLAKGTEDALQRIVIVNDRMTRRIEAEKHPSDRDYATVAVYTAE